MVCIFLTSIFYTQLVSILAFDINTTLSTLIERAYEYNYSFFLSVHYGYWVHFLTIGKPIVKRFKISLITTFTLQLFQLFSLVSSHVDNCEYFNFFSTIINPKINVIIFYAYSSKTKFTPRLLISIQALQKHHLSDNYHLEPPDHSL